MEDLRFEWGWFDTFSKKRKEWKFLLSTSNFNKQDQEKVLNSFIKWSSILLNSQHIPTKKLITKINDVMFASGFLPNKMFKIYDVLGDIECRVMDVESDKHKVKIISEIFKKSKKRFRKISQQNKEE